MTFTKAQCQGIMQLVLQQGLPALGVNWNFPRVVAHGLVTYQGLNLPNLYTKQMISHIFMVLKYGNLTDDPTGSLIWACGELLQLEVGICSPLFYMSPYLHVCTTNMRFSRCWFFCIQQGILIEDNIQDFTKPQERDQTIMEVFLRTGYWELELAIPNRCWMFLHVIFISDISNGQGTAIKKQFWTGTSVSEVHNYHWPKTRKLMPGEWVLWQQALSKGLNLGQAQTLAILLGKWQVTTLKLNGWFTNANSLQLYHQVNQEWSSFTPVPLH